MIESAISYDCRGEHAVGILHQPERPKRRGVLMVVAGGPQYRSGGHRQMTLWARRMASQGFPVMRFDHRGWGDSSGAYQEFEDLDEDIRAAMERFSLAFPEMDEIVLWGECNAASAILFYAYRDPRVKGLVLMNPWVRTEAGEAKAILKHYYLQRLTQPDFWKKVFSLRFNPLKAAGSALKLVTRARRVKPAAVAETGGLDLGAPLPRDVPLPDRMLAGLGRFQGPLMLVISGQDLVAREFEDIAKASPAWRDQLAAKSVTWHNMADGDHTFSSAVQRNQVVTWGLEWLETW